MPDIAMLEGSSYPYNYEETLAEYLMSLKVLDVSDRPITLVRLVDFRCQSNFVSGDAIRRLGLPIVDHLITKQVTHAEGSVVVRMEGARDLQSGSGTAFIDHLLSKAGRAYIGPRASFASTGVIDMIVGIPLIKAAATLRPLFISFELQDDIDKWYDEWLFGQQGNQDRVKNHGTEI